MIDESKVIIDVLSEDHVRIQHGWTEMGQGVHNMAIQTLCEETGIDPNIIEVFVDTDADIKTGMTTSSRGTALLGLAVINASVSLKEDLKTKLMVMSVIFRKGIISGDHRPCTLKQITKDHI